jgi:hypothetical protein
LKQVEVLESGGFGAMTWSPDASRLAYTGTANDMTEFRIGTIVTGATDVVLLVRQIRPGTHDERPARCEILLIEGKKKRRHSFE